MIRLIIRSTLTLMLAFTTSILTVAIIGNLKPVSPYLAGFVSNCEEKPRLCWYGIVPAKILASDLAGIMETTGLVMTRQNGLGFPNSLEPCFMSYREYDDLGGLVDGFFLWPRRCAQFTLGEVIGVPDYVEQECYGTLHFYFFGGLLAVTTSGNWIDSRSPIDAIQFNSKYFINDSESIYHWQGVFSLQYYQKRQGTKSCINRG